MAPGRPPTHPSSSKSPPISSAPPAVDRWIDGFFTSLARRRPVDASFIGWREHDARLPDFSESGLGDAEADAAHMLHERTRWPGPETDPWRALDARLIAGHLELRRLELASSHFERGNPSLYTGEAVFAVMSLFLNREPPDAMTRDAAVTRMEGLPELLVRARERVRAAPPEWTARALRECDGGLAFFGDGVERLAHDHPVMAGAAVRTAADRARAAFADHRHWLESELSARPTDGYAVGDAAFDAYLRVGHFLDEGADELAAYARDVIAESGAWLRAHARDHGAATPAEALSGLADLHPPRPAYYARYSDVWDDVRALSDRHDLVSWPDHPIRYVPRPVWSRAAAPHLYFLFYRSPAAHRRPPVHDYLVTPIEPDLPDDEARALLRAHNDSVIKLNHVVHHGGIGHHVQNGHAVDSPSRVGRVAAVDCASRIAMFCGGTMAEGWACYATDLVAEFGGLTPLEAYAERHTRVRMACRTVVDVELHHGRMSLAEAADFYRDTAGMTPAAAHGEAVKNSMFPGAAVMYLAGTDRLHALRRELAAKAGASFRLRDFHDRVLEHGSAPVALVAERMRAEAGL